MSHNIRYDAECTTGHIFEIDLPSSEAKSKFKCKIIGCNKMAEIVWLPPHISRMARNFEPTLLYRNKDGEIVAPGRNNPDHLPKKYRDDLARKGYKKIEITNFRQYEQFQREQRILLKDQRDKYISETQELYDLRMKDEIEALERGGTIELPNPDGKGSRIIQVPKLEDMAPAQRRLAEYAIAKAKGYRVESRESNPHIAAMEYDNQYYADKDTNWKRRS